MTREEAIARIKDHKIVHKMDEPRAIYISEALDMAIKALEQEPCEDAISRQAAIDLMILALEDDWESDYATDRMNELPPVSPLRPTGYNCNTDYAECDQFVCSECGIELQDWHRVERDADDGDITYYEYEFKYCPNCGADMRGEQE